MILPQSGNMSGEWHTYNGTMEEIQGQYGILKKIAKNQFDEDFLILRKGDTVPHGFTFPVSTK